MTRLACLALLCTAAFVIADEKTDRVEALKLLQKGNRANDERDYVREEIAAALQRGIMVIPVLIERVGLPRGADLPDDISEMILHQKDDVTHEHFGRDVHALVAAIKAGRKAAAAAARTPLLPIRSRIAAGVLGAMLVAAAAIYFARSPLLTLLAVPNAGSVSDPDQKRVEQERKRLQDLDDQLRQEREARALAEAESKRLSDAAAQTQRELELRQVPGPATEAAPQPKLLDAREPDTPPKKPAPLEASERSRPERLDKPQRAEKPNRPDKPERQAERERPQQQPQERRPSSAAATAVPGL